MKNAWYVDDDEEMIWAVRLMLRLLDYDTQSFLNARSAARALLAGGRPDLMLLDINMPEVTGVQLLEFIRSRRVWNNIPIIMLSSEATDIQVDEALSRGANAYVFKPVTIEELEASIAKVQRHI